MAKRRDSRALILAAAEKIFQDKRYHELTLDDVAQAAGVGKGTIYRYFTNKEDLIRQLATHGHDELCELLSGYVAATGVPLAELLEKMVVAMSDFYMGRHTLFRVMEQEGTQVAPDALRDQCRRELRGRRDRLLKLVAAVLAQGDSRGELRRDIELTTQANLLLGLVRARNRNFGDNPALIPSAEMIVSMFLDGACRRTKI